MYSSSWGTEFCYIDYLGSEVAQQFATTLGLSHAMCECGPGSICGTAEVLYSLRTPLDLASPMIWRQLSIQHTHPHFARPSSSLAPYLR